MVIVAETEVGEKNPLRWLTVASSDQSDIRASAS